MLEFIYNNLTFKAYNREEEDIGMECSPVVHFIVNEQGKLEQIKLLRCQDTKVGLEVLRVVEKMATQRWVAGFHHGKAVKVKYNLPFRIKFN